MDKLDDSTPRGDEVRSHLRLLTVFAVAGALALWIPPLDSSLRTDETATHWLTGDGAARAIERADEFQGESPVYYVLIAWMRSVVGDSEVALRLPSLIAMVAGAVLLIRLGRRLAGIEVGVLAAVILVTSEGITFAAGDARPYALAILATIGATLALVRWMDGSRLDAAAYVAWAVAGLYLHYFTALVLLAHSTYVLGRRNRTASARFLVAVAIIGLAMIPSISHLRSLVDRRAELAVSFPVELPDLFSVLVPPLLVGSGLLGVLLSRRWVRVQMEAPSVAPAAWTLAMGWWLLPSVMLFAVSIFSETTVFEPRFLLFSLPGWALVAAFGLGSIAPLRARRAGAAAILAISVLAFASTTHAPADWRRAAEVVREAADSNTPVLFRTGFIESTQVEWLVQQSKIEYLRSPLSPYPMPGRIILMPYLLSHEAEMYLQNVLDETLSHSQRFLLVNDRAGFEQWLRGRLPGWSVRVLNDRNVRVVLFSGAG